MSSTDYKDQMRDYHMQINALREKMRELRGEQSREPVDDYVFTGVQGDVRLSSLFGDKSTLFVIHNMGKSCTYCTLWADGFNGVLGHLQDRAAFVMTSPDAPDVQREFASSRGWGFQMLSNKDNSFAQDMGYKSDNGWEPGVSVFQKNDDGAIVRVANTSFGPGDDYCGVWHLFDLIPEGTDGWQPKFKY